MKILIQFDGLLRRFGRVVPDAIAMTECIRLIQSRLQASGRDTEITPLLFRIPGDRLSSSIGQCGDIVSLDEVNELKHYFGFTGESMFIRDDFLSLIGDQNERQREQLLVLTTNVDTYKRYVAEGVEVIRIGDSGSQTERWAPYTDVMRLLEERLRIPTARPMADSIRTGGLLAIQAQDVCAAWDRALTEIRKDPNADWIVLDNVLILYTENPDLEDSLEAEPGVNRLALAVHKDNLILTTDAQSSGLDALYQLGRFSLREVTQKQKADFDERVQQRTWNRIRRRRLTQAPHENTEKSKRPQAIPKKLVISTKVPDAIQAALAADARHWSQNLRELISNGLRHSASTGCFYEDGEPMAVTWMTSYGRTEKDLLVALQYRFSDEDVTRQDKNTLFANAVRGILAINQWIESIDERLAVVHCITLRRDVSIDRILESVLFEEEQNRLSHIIEFDELLSVQAGKEKLTISADPHIRDLLEEFGFEYPSVAWRELPHGETAVSQIRLVGGTWCQSPQDLNSASLVQAVLQTLLT